MPRQGEAKRRAFWDAVQDFARRIEPLFEDSHEKGKRWEREFADMATGRGLHVEEATGRGDWVVNGSVVQCKSVDAVRHGDTIDVANMRPVAANDNERGYRIGEYDVLALRHQGGVYLIPAAWMCVGNGMLASSVRLSCIGCFADAWNVFDAGYVPPKRDQQQSFLDGA